MKLTEYLKEQRALSIGQLSAKIKEENKKLISLKQDFLLGKLKDTSLIRKKRRDLARLKTIIDEKISQELNDEK